MSAKCKIIVPENEIDKKIYKFITNDYRKGYVEIGKEKIIMPQYYANIADKIENFEVRDSDIWIVSHPKSGTTWCQEMTWLIANDLNYDNAKVELVYRFNFLELESLFDVKAICANIPGFEEATAIYDSINIAKNDQRNPRFFKCHLPWCLLPKAFKNGTTKAKIVYVARNPKDTCVSYYHHQRLFEGFSGTFEDFCQMFIAGRLNYGPFWTHILEFWKQRNNENILLLKYEDMKRDLPSVITKISNFLNKKIPSKEEILKLVDHLSFENMKNNPYTNYESVIEHNQAFIKSVGENRKFMKSGQVGGYKAEMTEEIEKIFDKWIEENSKNYDITF